MSRERGRTLDGEEIERLAERLDSVLQWLAERTDPEVAGAVAELLEGVQRVHGEGLRRLAGLLVEDGARWDRALSDPVISSLFELYELEVARPRESPHPDEASSSPEDADAPEGSASRGDPPPSAPSGGRSRIDPGGVSPTGDVAIVPRERLVQLERRLPAEDARGGDDDRAERIAEIPLAELDREPLFASLVDDTPILVVRHGEGVRAYRNACPGSPLPLHVGTLDGTTLVCPWHGCRFDVRSGERESGEGPPLDRLASRVRGGHVRVLVP